MALTLFKERWPYGKLTRWFGDLDNWFENDFFTRTPELHWEPPMDVEEKHGKYLVKAELPGLKKKDIHVELHDGYLTLKGERCSEHKDEDKNYRRIERSYGSFHRTFRVPEGTTEKDIKAKYRDGVLELTITAPKVETPKATEIKIA